MLALLRPLQAEVSIRPSASISCLTQGGGRRTHVLLSARNSCLRYTSSWRLPRKQFRSNTRLAHTSSMAPPSLRHILTSQEDGIALIKWNRPKHANALGDGIGDDLLAALRWADSESSVRVLVLTGVGKFFSAGMDLKDVPDEGPVLPGTHPKGRGIGPELRLSHCH